MPTDHTSIKELWEAYNQVPLLQKLINGGHVIYRDGALFVTSWHDATSGKAEEVTEEITWPLTIIKKVIYDIDDEPLRGRDGKVQPHHKIRYDAEIESNRYEELLPDLKEFHSDILANYKAYEGLSLRNIIYNHIIAEYPEDTPSEEIPEDFVAKTELSEKHFATFKSGKKGGIRKQTLLAIAVGYKWPPDKTNELLKFAGHALSPIDTVDRLYSFIVGLADSDYSFSDKNDLLRNERIYPLGSGEYAGTRIAIDNQG